MGDDKCFVFIKITQYSIFRKSSSMYKNLRIKIYVELLRIKIYVELEFYIKILHKTVV